MNNKIIPLVMAVGLGASFNANASVLLENDVLRLTYKNYYWNEDPNSYGSIDGGSTRNEWVHAALLDYSTGYINDWIKLDYGFAVADQLSIGSDVTDVSNLPSNSADITNPDSMVSTQTAYLSLRYPGDTFALTAGAGKKRRSSLLYDDSNSRILPSTTVGFDLSADTEKLTLYFTQFDKHSPRNNDNWGDSLENFLGEEIEYVSYFGAQYRFDNGLSVDAMKLEAKDYLRERLLKAQYSMPLSQESSLQMSFIYGNQQDAGQLFERSGLGGYAPAGDLDVDFYDAGIDYQHGPYTLSLNYLTVKGGDFNRVLFSSDHGTWNTSGNNWSFNGLENEKMIRIGVATDFSQMGVPGLFWVVQGIGSYDAAGYDDFSRKELVSYVSYDFQGALKGLNVSWYADIHRAEGEVDGVKRTESVVGPAGLERKDVNRFYLSYSKEF
ncbi:OprD family outer membrane porin [Marinobacterium stanieri]|uniref:Outer membrane porin, OprD family n=1 Tax=Marinobacterium stanieri TaxID=49186 RepID=A0A1N6SIL8_9GAMM|nr:OprD family outer membrane porin [Marinobacterium stanieri]SIQ40812.1 outer membrane porin, OprD family [Marinobacterium stanieri]